MFAPLFSRRGSRGGLTAVEGGSREKREERIGFRDGDTKRVGEVRGMEGNARRQPGRVAKTRRVRNPPTSREAEA